MDMTAITRSGILLGLLCALMGSVPGHATELIYVPTNPTFGGNPNNAAGLMAAAVAQNKHKAPPSETKTAAERFAASVQSAVLTRLTSKAVGQLFDEDGNPITGVQVQAGEFAVKFETEGEDLVLYVTNAGNPGASSRIVIGGAADLSGGE